MNCPKCSYEQSEANTECEKCGIIFAKYYSRLHSKEEKRPALEDEASASLVSLLFYTRPDQSLLSFYARLLLLIGMIFWGAKFMLSPLAGNYAGKSLLHLANLPFHEAGHVFFKPFGAFMTSLGGTVGQLAMPLICFCVLLVKTRDPFGASVTLWWFGQNFFDIAPYINDARSLSLPLLGGNVGHSSPYGFHDWEYLLSESGLLRYDHFLAKVSVTTGSIIFFISCLWGAVLVYRQYKSRT